MREAIRYLSVCSGIEAASVAWEQGFRDDWTLIPYRGRAAEDCPDGPRYRALSNSMAVNCMEWIGERIAAFEERRPSRMVDVVLRRS